MGTDLLSISLSKMSDVVREHSEVVWYSVLLAEANYDWKTHSWSRVPCTRWFCRCWPSDYCSPVNHLRDVLLRRNSILMECQLNKIEIKYFFLITIKVFNLRNYSTLVRIEPELGGLYMHKILSTSI